MSKNLKWAIIHYCLGFVLACIFGASCREVYDHRQLVPALVAVIALRFVLLDFAIAYGYLKAWDKEHGG